VSSMSEVSSNDGFAPDAAMTMFNDSDTITLKDAAEHFGLSVYTLRTEADRQRLRIYKIGKRYYTTPAEVKEMIQLCRADQKAHDFTLIRSDSSTSSATERSSSVLAAANLTANRLINSSRTTLGKSIPRNRQVRP
jgi:Helix-turn-helix domain